MVVRQGTNQSKSLNKWVEKHKTCKCFHTGAPHATIQQPTSMFCSVGDVKMLSRPRWTWFCLKVAKGKDLSEREGSLLGHSWLQSQRLLNWLMFQQEQWLKWRLRLDLWERLQYKGSDAVVECDARALVWYVRKHRRATILQVTEGSVHDMTLCLLTVHQQFHAVHEALITKKRRVQWCENH